MKVNNLPLAGLHDLFGLALRKRDCLSRIFSDIVRNCGYEQLEVPLIERASSFSEGIVGESPWPEWDKRGCFYINILDYSGNYEKIYEKNEALLIPEGTVSVSRWLGRKIDENPRFQFPLKVFYNNLPCFRNELVDTLSSSKRRQFNQFGVEILGSSNVMSDVEILSLSFVMLEKVGINKTDITARISDVRIFSALAKECGIVHKDSLTLKEAMDTVAECRAGKKPERRVEQERIFWGVIDRYTLSDVQKNCWKTIINHQSGMIHKEIFDLFPSEYHGVLENLNNVRSVFLSQGLNVKIDLSVVRSHEYYTGLSFELDVKVEEVKYVEIAGGGRYDKLVGNFVNNTTLSRIPSTGFAFGIERVIEMLEKTGFFKKEVKMLSHASFEESSADLLILASNGSGPVRGYFDALTVAREEIIKGNRCDIYVGDDSNEPAIVEYMAQRNIKKRG